MPSRASSPPTTFGGLGRLALDCLPRPVRGRRAVDARRCASVENRYARRRQFSPRLSSAAASASVSIATARLRVAALSRAAPNRPLRQRERDSAATRGRVARPPKQQRRRLTFVYVDPLTLPVSS